ncbi:hypothetical protein C2D30_16645 [Escherichia coli]|nr:hypothetical protein [Escherichia coli]EFA4952823.1 hypothetical protein [Escherichia coli]
MDFTKRQAATFTGVTRQHHAPTGCAEIDGDTIAKGHNVILLNFITTSLKSARVRYLLVTDRKIHHWQPGKDERDSVHNFLNCGGVMFAAFPENSRCILKNRHFLRVLPSKI